MQKRAKVAFGTAVALGAGYLVGVLTAPKSGRETRKDIRKKALQAKAEAEQKLKEAHSEISRLLTDANAKAKAGKAKVSADIQDVLDKADHARLKAKELLSAVHEGEAEDEELQKAVEDTRQAIIHLKKYLGKKAN